MTLNGKYVGENCENLRAVGFHNFRSNNKTSKPTKTVTNASH